MFRNFATRIFSVPAIIIVMLLGANNFCQGQEDEASKKEKKEMTKQAVNNAVEVRSYYILANQASTQRGKNINLTSTYFISVKHDTLACDLPYFGQSYAGTGYGGGGGVNFKSVKYSYDEKPGKKGGWEITIKPEDSKDVQVIQFYIGPEGFTTINMSFTNRSAMRYSGVIELDRKSQQ